MTSQKLHVVAVIYNDDTVSELTKPPELEADTALCWSGSAITEIWSGSMLWPPDRCPTMESCDTKKTSVHHDDECVANIARTSSPALLVA